MKLSDFKGADAFKVMGKLLDVFKVFFADEGIKEIYDKKEKGWINNLFTYSLENCSEAWVELFLIFNPDLKKDDVNLARVFVFATEVMNDEELMQLFFSQGKTTLVTSIGLATENTEV